MGWGTWFCQKIFKSLIGLSPIWSMCICVGFVWHSKHVLRHFHLCSCIVHWCSSLLHAMCLTECSCEILVVYWTQMSSIAWVYFWLNMFHIFWSMSVCFTHFPILCLTMPWHAPPRHPLGTPHASPAAQHMHTHAQSFISCIRLLFTYFNTYSMLFSVCYALF